MVTGANMFLRSMGSAVGVAIFGAVANGVIARSGLGEHSPVAIQAASSAVFLAVLVAAVVTIAAAVAMPARARRRYRAPPGRGSRRLTPRQPERPCQPDRRHRSAAGPITSPS